MWGASWFGGSGAQKRKDAPKKAILDLRQQLDMLQKREKHLENQMAEQEAIARKNVATNKTGMPTSNEPVLQAQARPRGHILQVRQAQIERVQCIEEIQRLTALSEQPPEQPSNERRPMSTPLNKPPLKSLCSKIKSIPSSPQTSTKKLCLP